MACGCGKKNAAARAGGPSPAALGASAAKGSARRTPVKTRVRQTAQEMPTQGSRRPYNPMRYYVVAPDGTEAVYNTLAEAQTILRRHGGPVSGYLVESRRDSS